MMAENDWQTRLFEIVVEVAPEYALEIHKHTEYHFFATLQVNDPERSNITFAVYRKDSGVLSLRNWDPATDIPELKAKIEDYFLSLQQQKTLNGISKSALKDFERLAEELRGVGVTVTWKQIEDFRVKLSANGLSEQRCDLLVYYKNSGISAKRTSVNFLNGDEQLSDQIQETLFRLFPNPDSDR